MHSIIEGFASSYEIARLIKRYFGRSADSDLSSGNENRIEVRLLKEVDRRYIYVEIVWNNRQADNKKEAPINRNQYFWQRK